MDCLTVFCNAAELAAIVDGAPGLLNTLNELAAAIGDDPTFFTTVATNLANHTSSSTNIHGIADTSLLVTNSSLTTSLATVTSTLSGNLTAHEQDTTSIHGISDTANLVYAVDLSSHNSDTTSVHGIADTSQLTTQTQLSSAIAAEAVVTAGNLSSHESDTTSVHGISNTANLVYQADLTDHNSDTTSVHGISDTADLVYQADLTDHNLDTLNVHGISNTANLVYQSDLTDAIDGAEVNQALLAGTGIDWNEAELRFDIDSTVATKTYADNAVSTHQSDSTNVHGIADTSLLATTANVATAKSEAITAAGTAADSKVSTAVAALTKSSVGLANVDNTADSAKPVSTAQATAIATAKSEAIADATSQVNALISGAPGALNTLDELAAALGDDANFATTVTNGLAAKAPINAPTFTGTVTVAAAGIAFTDGTQTAEGVPSRTPIIQKTASYTLSALTERDDLIEMGSATAVTLSIPTDATLNFPIGTSIDILQTGAGQVTIAAVTPGTTTVNATPGLKLRTTWSSCTLFKRAANTWVVYGDLTA